MYVCVSAWIPVSACMPEHPVEARGQFTGVNSLLPFEFQGLNSGCQGWQQTLYPIGHTLVLSPLFLLMNLSFYNVEFKECIYI